MSIVYVYIPMYSPDQGASEILGVYLNEELAKQRAIDYVINAGRYESSWVTRVELNKALDWHGKDWFKYRKDVAHYRNYEKALSYADPEMKDESIFVSKGDNDK